MTKIIVLPHDSGWAGEFDKIRAELEAALAVPGVALLGIEHVGSTSVEGLYAKPIIDIDIVVAKGNFSAASEALAAIAYTHQGDLGIPSREAFKYEGKEHLMRHNLYVCEEDSPELRRHLTLRNHLRENAEDRERYSAIKLEMAARYPYDIDSYLEGKGPVILEIYDKYGVRS